MAKPLGPTGEFFRRRDEWRKHPMLTNQWRHATPGLGIALVAFGIYLVGETVYEKIYAPKLYGLEDGPLRNLPFHPTHPFTTIIVLNTKFCFRFPKEAYLLLWYLVDTYKIGMIINRHSILQYLHICATSRMKKKHILLLKWLRLFGSISWWQQQLKEKENGECMLVILGCARENRIEHDGAIRIVRNYRCEVLGFHRLPQNLKEMMCVANGVDPNTLSPDLFSCGASDFQPKFHPQDFIREIRDCVLGFEKQYAWDRSNPDHPCYRVDGERFNQHRKYVPGFKIFVDDTSSSDSSDSEGCDDFDLPLY